MNYQFIEQYKQEFPVVVMCQALGVSRSAAFMLGASVLPVDASEKMLCSLNRFDRYLALIERDMAVRVFMLSWLSKDAHVRASALPDSCERQVFVPKANGDAS